MQIKTISVAAILLILVAVGCASNKAQPPAADMSADSMTNHSTDAMESDSKKQSPQATPWDDAYK